MKDGFIKAGAATPKIMVADCKYNADTICETIQDADQKGIQLLVLPELCITGYTCGDLFWQDTLLEEALTQLLRIKDYTRGREMLVYLGLPVMKRGKLYNTMAALNNGRILAIIPKTHLPNYAEFYEARQFTPGNRQIEEIVINGERIPFGTDILLSCEEFPELVVGAEICEDVWAPDPPSVRHAMSGATVIVNSSASDEITGKERYRKSLITGHSSRLVCAYLYANAGDGESTTDLVFGGHNIIAENGKILGNSRPFSNKTAIADIDIKRISSERRKLSTFLPRSLDGYQIIPFNLPVRETVLERKFRKKPFVPDNKQDRTMRCEEILTIQAMGLKKRLEHTHCQSAVIGISGGLDSTLALLVTARTFDLLNIDRENITAVTMPCFGTTDRTYQNACILTEKLGAALREVNIKEAVLKHFQDIGHNPDNHDVTYENAQARERTQILMDIANQTNGIVIGTGDMSELALGWATYNGDHMSMYGVNASIPKTLVRYLVEDCAETAEDETLKKTLYDILDTPVSPELLPPKEGEINQKTEDLVGPYELHDFFLYYMLRFGFSPSKIYRIAKLTFAGDYSDSCILKWMKVFYRRFFSQQFKRSCLPDGPKVGTVALSPRGDLRMPSDASANIWLAELESIENI